MADMPLVDEKLLAEFACLDPIYVQDIAGIWPLGPHNFATGYYRLQPTKSEGGVILYERVPALCIVRPRSSGCRNPTCDYMTYIDMQTRRQSRATGMH